VFLAEIINVLHVEMERFQTLMVKVVLTLLLIVKMSSKLLKIQAMALIIKAMSVQNVL